MILKTVVEMIYFDLSLSNHFSSFFSRYFLIKLFEDVDKTKTCATKLYGRASYGIICVDPMRAIGTYSFYKMLFSLCFYSSYSILIEAAL